MPCSTSGQGLTLRRITPLMITTTTATAIAMYWKVFSVITPLACKCERPSMIASTLTAIRIEYIKRCLLVITGFLNSRRLHSLCANAGPWYAVGRCQVHRGWLTHHIREQARSHRLGPDIESPTDKVGPCWS